MSRPADAAELDAIRTHFNLDRIAERQPQYEVLQVEGRFEGSSNPDDSMLRADISFRPHVVQGQLCYLERWHASARLTDEDWNWGDTSSDSFYWEPDNDACTFTDRRSLPDDHVLVLNAVPTAQVIQTFRGQTELLAAGFDFVFHEADLEAIYGPSSDRMRTVFEEFRDEYVLKLSGLELSRNSGPDAGLFLQAWYADVSRGEGPILFFSVTPEGFLVHGFTLWME